MEFLPKDLQDIIMDYKKDLEHFEKFKHCIADIKNTHRYVEYSHTAFEYAHDDPEIDEYYYDDCHSFVAIGKIKIVIDECKPGSTDFYGNLGYHIWILGRDEMYYR